MRAIYALRRMMTMTHSSGLRGPACKSRVASAVQVVLAGCNAVQHRTCVQRSTMNSPLEPASPASSSSESFTDDVPMTQEHPGSATHEKERSGFLSNPLAFAKSVAKRRLPGGSSKTTSNRDSKARRREDGGQRKGGSSDRRDPAKSKDDLLDVALFEHLKKSAVIFARLAFLSPHPPFFLTEIGDPLLDDFIKRAS